MTSLRVELLVVSLRAIVYVRVLVTGLVPLVQAKGSVPGWGWPVLLAVAVSRRLQSSGGTDDEQHP
jgi:hypothetical protein